MKASELREKTIEEIQQAKLDLKQELLNLRFQKESNQLENPHLIKNKKRDLARVMTILNEKLRQSQV